ncbi:protein of unknown function [Nitratireductor aquimarinus]
MDRRVVVLKRNGGNPVAIVHAIKAHLKQKTPFDLFKSVFHRALKTLFDEILMFEGELQLNQFERACCRFVLF